MSYESGFNTGLGGLQYIAQQIDAGRERKRQEGFDQQRQQVFDNEQQRQGQQDNAQKLGRLASYLTSVPAPMRPQAYAQMRSQIDQLGQSLGLPPAPDVWDESHLPEVEQVAQWGGMGGSTKPNILSPGAQLVGNDGRVIHQNDNFAPIKPTYDSSRGGFASPDGFTQVAPPKADYEAERLALARDANERARQAAQDAAEARRRSQWGTAPAGQRFRDDGTLEAIPGYVAPLSAVERREQAARRARMPQVANLTRGMARIDKALEGIDNSLARFGGVNTGPLDQMVMGKLPAGQELEAAVGGIQNSLLSLTRVPGIGSQSDLEARIAMLQYPSLDKPPEVNRRTLENLKAFVADLQAAYGAANEADAPAPTSQAPVQSAPKVQEGTVIVDRKTGHRMVRKNGQWVDL